SWDLLTAPHYVGLDNYRALVSSGELQNAVLVTLLYSVIVVAGATVVGLALALALDRPGRFAALMRGAIFSAYVVSWVSVGLLWLWLMDADSGAINHGLRALGLPAPKWLADPAIAPYALAGVTIWKIAGYSMVLFIAGLQSIPPEVLEAAELDGAGPRARFFRVTWPLLRPTAVFVLTTSLILSFQVFDVVRVMTQGGPVRSTTVLVYAIYEQIFLNLRVGRASALVMVFFVLLLGLTLLELWAFRKREEAT
ncbi:MAG TPA: sugar ABC transporter permease, partial [Polyangiaceae bacterium]|nr:sugar ABC transporter permease [Polyangiaceae bacterium]